MTVGEYILLKATLTELGYRDEITWAQSVKPPATPEALWREYAWVVINSGMKNQVAQGIWERVRPVVEGGASAATVFRHANKVKAIDRGWKLRDLRFDGFQVFKHDVEETLKWCESLSMIGPITKWHLAKNLGVECAKPDRWLERVAAVAGETVEQLCSRLAHESRDRIATVDLVIWRACNLGLVAV